jgi:DNA-binding GntR family transcriptional regulator
MTQPAAHQTLTDKVTEQIRRRLINGEFMPGQRLSEAALTQSLDVSRNTLREAFRNLTKEGLLTHSPNRGVAVAVPSMASIIDIYRVRRMIECQALAQAYPHHPARQRMRRSVEDALACRERQDWPGVGTANMAFHMAIVELADSDRLNAMFSLLLAELRLVFGLLQDPEFLHAPYAEMNQQILQSVEAGDFGKAADALKDYLAQSERIVLASYARRVAA